VVVGEMRVKKGWNWGGGGEAGRWRRGEGVGRCWEGEDIFSVVW
jgi:hypothetical protein